MIALNNNAVKNELEELTKLENYQNYINVVHDMNFTSRQLETMVGFMLFKDCKEKELTNELKEEVIQELNKLKEIVR